MTSKVVLYSYYRSSSSYRVRIALNLKEIEYEYKAVNLLKGEQRSEEFLRMNPMGQVPAIVIDGKIFSQSISILEYLEEKFPEKFPLLPKDPESRAKVRELNELIASGIHPIQNVSVLKYYSSEQAKREEWANHWIGKGLKAVETLLSKSSGKYCFGEQITMADICLIPQVYNAVRHSLLGLKWICPNFHI